MAMNKGLKTALWVIFGTLGALVVIPIVIGVILAVDSPGPITHKPIPPHRVAKADEHPGTQPTEHVRAATAAKHVASRPAKRPDLDAKVSQAFYDDEKGDPPGTLAKLKLAARLAAQGANCASVTLSTYIPRHERYPGHENQPYYVTCNAKHGPVQGFAYGVYFTEADLEAHRVKNQRQPISKDRAIDLCEAAIKSQLRYPSSFDLKVFGGGGVSDNGTTNREVDLPFTALNGLGNRVPQMGRCIVQPDGKTEVTIRDR